MDQGKTENLEEWSTVMEEKMPRFDDVFDRLKGAIINAERKEEAKTMHEVNIIQQEFKKS